MMGGMMGGMRVNALVSALARVRASEAKGAVGSTRGAIYVEFLVAFFPVFTTFLGLVQIADLYQANLIVQHSAVAAARAAVVVLPDDGSYYDNVEVGHFSGKRKEDIVKAASLTMFASRSLTELRVTLPSSPGSDDSRSEVQRDDLIRVQVRANFECRVPFVNRLVCDAQSGLKTISAEAAFPNQGASFTY